MANAILFIFFPTALQQIGLYLVFVKMKKHTTTSIKDSRVAVVGSGIAGLSAAIRAAVAGAEVHVYEQNSYTGGKVTAFQKDGFRFDAGPSLFTLPNLVDDLFKLAGENPRDYFNYHVHNTVCNYFWRDGTRFSMYPQLEKNIDVISKNFSSLEASRVADYFSDAAKKYNLTSPYFLENSLHKPSTFMTLEVLKVLRAIPSLGLFSSLDEENKKYFKDPKLVQLFNRYATYNGSSPFLTPGIMQMITHLEHGLGTYLPKGGMHEISQSLTRLALKLGVEFHLGHKVEKLNSVQNKMVGIQVNGIEHPCDTIFVNSDVKHAYSHLLSPELKRPKKTLKQEPSSSALIFYWGINGSFPQLDLHNIFFSDNYEKEFEAIQHNGAFWEDPTVYVNITSKLEDTDAPKGHENWFVMINVPSNQGQPWDEIIPKVKNSILQRLTQELGVDIKPLILTEELLDPRSIERKTSSVGGALYGTSSNDRMAAFLRHPNKKSGVHGLYFCGGSAHPGGGVPLCLLSGKIATDWWLEDDE
jgi:phytoene desaturase